VRSSALLRTRFLRSLLLQPLLLRFEKLVYFLNERH